MLKKQPEILSISASQQEDSPKTSVKLFIYKMTFLPRPPTSTLNLQTTSNTFKYEC